MRELEQLKIHQATRLPHTQQLTMHGVLQTAQISRWDFWDGEISSGSSSMLQDWKLELQKCKHNNWSPKTRNLPALAAAQLEWVDKGAGVKHSNNWPVCHSGLRLCPYTLCMRICSSSLSSGSSEQTSSDQGDECFLPGGTFPDDLTQKAKHTCRQEGAS